MLLQFIVQLKGSPGIRRKFGKNFAIFVTSKALFGGAAVTGKESLACFKAPFFTLEKGFNMVLIYNKFLNPTLTIGTSCFCIPPRKATLQLFPSKFFQPMKMRASDSWFPLLLPLFGMIRHRKLAGPTFLPFQLSRHQRTSSHCWMLSSWIWTRGSLAATATHFATAWHCFVQGLLHPTSTKAVDELLPVVRDLQAICLFFFVSFAEDFVKIRWFLSVLSQNSSICLAFFCGAPGKYRQNTQKKMAPLRPSTRKKQQFPWWKTARWGWDSKPATFVRCWSDCWVRTLSRRFWIQRIHPRKFPAEKHRGHQVVGDP